MFRRSHFAIAGLTCWLCLSLWLMNRCFELLYDSSDLSVAAGLGGGGLLVWVDVLAFIKLISLLVEELD